MLRKTARPSTLNFVSELEAERNGRDGQTDTRDATNNATCCWQGDSFQSVAELVNWTGCVLLLWRPPNRSLYCLSVFYHSLQSIA